MFNCDTDTLHTFTFTENDVKKCKSEPIWEKKLDTLIEDLIPQYFKNGDDKNAFKCLVTYIARTKEFLGSEFNYKDYNCYVFFIEPKVFEFIDICTVKNRKHSVEFSKQTLSMTI